MPRRKRFCRKCGEVQVFGQHRVCDACKQKRKKEYRHNWEKAHREERNVYRLELRKRRTPEQIEKESRQAHERYERLRVEDPAEFVRRNAVRKRWQEEHPDKAAESYRRNRKRLQEAGYFREYYQKHKDELRAYYRAYYQRKKQERDAS